MSNYYKSKCCGAETTRTNTVVDSYMHTSFVCNSCKNKCEVKSMTTNIKERIRATKAIQSILLRNFDNNKYLWSVADRELTILIEDLIDQAVKEREDEIVQIVAQYSGIDDIDTKAIIRLIKEK